MLNIDFENNKNFLHLKRNLITGKSFVLTGLTSFLRLLLVQKIKEVSQKRILFITASEQNALKYQNDFKTAFGTTAEIFPYQNISMYEGVSPNLYDYSKQLEILNSGAEVIIFPVKALLEKFPDRNFIKKNSINLKIGDEIDTKEFAQKLVALGYKRSTMVSDISEFSIRGDIIDVFSLSEYPVRIELWGDEIVDLRFFNNETQKSIEKVKECSIKPVYKFMLGSRQLPDFISEKIENEGFFEGIEVYQSYFNDNLVSIFDYLSSHIIIFDEMSEIFSKYEFIAQNHENQMLENLKLGLNIELKSRNHFEIEELHKQIAGFAKIGLNNFIDYDYEDLIEFDSQSLKNYFANPDEIAEFINSKPDYKTIIATDYPERVKELFAERNVFNLNFIENISCAGCVLDGLKIILLTDRELFNKRPKEITASKRSYYKEKPEFIESINDIKEGEYVVHSVHGVGIFRELSQQQIDGQYKDYLTIEYANKDILHIPAEQVNLLCRYRGSGTVKPKLSKMGGNDWTSVKTRVKKEVEKIAYDLLRLYAKRKMQEGIVFEPDTPWQAEMEEAFEYVETPDQMKAIIDVKADMENGTPMDRLICGDVGFGKTEVAIRAIFKAISSGKQSAIIAPTTILAMQHFQTIQERFNPFGVNVQLLSRFRNAKEQKQTLKELALGTCDVVVATHRLLQDDVKFKNLGLLVIDEEHRFGVRHKEKLKKFKENIDIISMSATPIPRTLYMSLSGIKDMSVINTPPKNRLPIKTFVGEFNETSIKNAITHELDRDGQVFYLYNRVETIEEFKLRLQKIVPNARILVGHAKLDEKTLEKVMVDFANKEFDILLCTTIIESGLDIPNANTIIIHDADKFGLAQLYQLRGRVGRCERQAYCYCFYKKNKTLTQEALQRLKAIKEFTTLGSGYQVALRDVEIRGVGNILGTKQHGHMVNVGFDTYCQLLEETIRELKGEQVEQISSAIVDINVTAYIPDEWVGSQDQKMIEYKRLADVKSQIELDYIIDEWKDRFSTPPDCVQNLIKLIKIRLAATDAKISVIRETSDNIRIYTPYLPAEWKIIQSNLSRNITKYIKFISAPKACTEGNSIILLDNSCMNFEEIFNILLDLFYYVYKVSHEYTK
ncbi:MAG: transcription-repair coupling factor [Candidatus Gastranaerophilaceae bacterium]